MTWKKTGLAAMASLLFLSGCIPGLEPKEEGVDIEQEDSESEETKVEVSPEIPSLDSYYRSILHDGKYIPGVTRGFNTDVVYNRLDLERLEVGMQEIASEEFNQETYFFREGQFIKKDELNHWLMRYKEGGEEGNPMGLNPPLGNGESFEQRERSQPRVLSNILEHNYIFENDEGSFQVGGIVIGLSMNSVYYFRERHEDGTYGPWLEEEIPEEVSLEEGKQIAAKVLERLRSSERENGQLTNVPVMFALFRENPREAVVPGEFIATGFAKPNQEVGNWQQINETHLLFPSREATEYQREDAEVFNQFKEDVNQFFENYVGVVGEGHYRNGELRSLTIEIPITFYSKTEVIAFTQHVTDRVKQRFPEELEVEIQIVSPSGQEALVLKEPGSEPFTHIY